MHVHEALLLCALRGAMSLVRTSALMPAGTHVSSHIGLFSRLGYPPVNGLSSVMAWLESQDTCLPHRWMRRACPVGRGRNPPPVCLRNPLKEGVARCHTTRRPLHTQNAAREPDESSVMGSGTRGSGTAATWEVPSVGKDFILAFDQGTTSSRTIVFDREGAIHASVSQEFEQIYPRPGWVEHDPETIWTSQLDTARAAMSQAGLLPGDIAAIGITNQRETAVVWERATGRPIHNAIVWQCRRTADLCDQLVAEGMADEFRARTGLVIDAYFSGTKVKWLLDHVDGARARAAKGELCFGTVDAWLLFKLTGLHATDYSNASRTMIYNIHDLRWDASLLSRLDIPAEMLADVKPSSHVYGTTSALGGEIPVAALCGDQQSALFGQTGFKPNDSKNTYGTGCFALINTGETPVPSRHGLLTTLAWGVGGRVEYALEGGVFIGGAVVQWLRDELGMLPTAEDSEAVARQVADSGGVYIVPAFVGLGAPYWDMHARGTIVGLTRGSNRAHIVRAALEAISYQSADVLQSMEADTGLPMTSLRVDGGAARNDLLMQHQADVLGIPVVRGQTLETTALGAAFLAGLSVGIWSGTGELEGVWGQDRVFTPQWDEDTRARAKNGWRDAVKMTTMRKT
jgi:glycerol kinase